MKSPVLVAVLACVLVLAGCTKPGQADVSGANEKEAVVMELEEQYGLAGERHQELNKRFAELQAEIFDDQWREGATHSEVVPGQGGTRGNDLPGATNDNSYYFSVARWHPTDADLKALLQKTAQSWEDRGWTVGEETLVNGDIRITTMTNDGYWFAADERSGEIGFEGMSPVYFGERRALSRAIAERRTAEDEAGATWDTTDLDEKGHAYRPPGVFRPFPLWDAVKD